MSAIISDVGLGTQASLLWITLSISWTVVVNFASDYANTLNIWIGIRYGFFRTSAIVGTFGISTCCSMPANVGFGTFVNVYTLLEGIS